MEWHEKICWRNPKRFCEECNNTGRVTIYHDEALVEETSCRFCCQKDDGLLESLAEAERESKEEKKPSEINIDDVPF